MPGGKITPRTIAQREKERRALLLRKGGASYDAIAIELGMSNRTAARRLVVRAFERITNEPAEHVLALELQRLDGLYEIAWREAHAEHPMVRGQYLIEGVIDVGPNLKAIEVCLAIAERRARYQGLDAPSKSRVEVVTAEDVEAAIARLEAEASK